MSGTDKAKNKVQNLVGKAKEAVGKVTGDRRTENEGKGASAASSDSPVTGSRSSNVDRRSSSSSTSRETTEAPDRRASPITADASG